MRKPVLLIVTNAMILVVVFLLLAQSLFVVQRMAQAQDTKGRVEVQRSGQGSFQPLTRGATIAVGDVVRTGQDGEVEFAWIDRTRWRLVSNTTLTVQRASVDAEKHVEAARFRLDTGKVFVRMVKVLTPDSSFEVETPTAIAAVRGTVFSIAIEGGQTKVEVWRGDVSLTDEHGAQGTVKSGQQAMAGCGAVQIGATPVKQAAPANLLRPDLDVEVVSGANGRAFVRGATEASDMVTIDNKIVPVLANGAFFKTVKLAPGHNQWTVTTIDKHGASATQCRALEFDAATQKTRPSTCRAN